MAQRLTPNTEVVDSISARGNGVIVLGSSDFSVPEPKSLCDVDILSLYAQCTVKNWVTCEKRNTLSESGVESALLYIGNNVLIE